MQALLGTCPRVPGSSSLPCTRVRPCERVLYLLTHPVAHPQTTCRREGESGITRQLPTAQHQGLVTSKPQGVLTLRRYAKNRAYAFDSTRTKSHGQVSEPIRCSHVLWRTPCPEGSLVSPLQLSLSVLSSAHMDDLGSRSSRAITARTSYSAWSVLKSSQPRILRPPDNEIPTGRARGSAQPPGKRQQSGRPCKGTRGLKMLSLS